MMVRKKKTQPTRRKAKPKTEQILFNLCGELVWLQVEVMNEAAGELLVNVLDSATREDGEWVSAWALEGWQAKTVSLNRDYVLARRDL